MNLVALALGLFETCCVNDSAARRIGFDSACKGGRMGEIENGLQHLDYVVERVFVIIQNNHVILLAEFISGRFLDISI